MATRCIKIATQIGAPVKLRRIYNRILRLTRKLPPGYAYRIQMEPILCERLCIVHQTQDVTEIENRICEGQIEILVSQALEEYELVKKIIQWKPWEPLIEKPPPDQWKWPLVPE